MEQTAVAAVVAQTVVAEHPVAASVVVEAGTLPVVVAPLVELVAGSLVERLVEQTAVEVELPVALVVVLAAYLEVGSLVVPVVAAGIHLVVEQVLGNRQRAALQADP